MASDDLQRLLPGLAPPLAALLDPARGALAPPVRAEIFGAARFAQHGHSLGLTHRAERGVWPAATFRPRLNENIAVLREAQRCIGAHAATGYDVSPAAEWLLDNFHLIEAQLQQVHDGLPRRYFRRLPLLQDPPLAGLPRVYGVAWAFVAHTDGAFDEELLITFLEAYQAVRELGLGELWALPTTLRVVLVESLRRLAERVAASKAAREAANLCCDDLEAHPVAWFDAWLPLMAQRGVARAFLVQVALRLQEPAAAGAADPFADRRAWLARALPDPVAAKAQQVADQTADNLSVSNAVTALREIDGADWADIVEWGSPLMRLMLAAPAFAADHPGTRAQAMQAIEALARRSGRSEIAVAQALRDCMAGGTDDQTRGAGHWLDGPGRPALRRRLGLRGGRVPRAGRGGLALLAYLGTLIGATGALLVATGAAAAGWAVMLLAAFPASEAVLALLHRLISESLPPRPLPRLALADGIGAEQRVLVVIPALLSDDATIDALVHRLLLHHLANIEPQAQFALLSDHVDAPTETLPADAPLLAHAVAAIEDLNRTWGEHGAPPRFLLLHRTRRFSESEQAWIGWERKRGKLLQLAGLLAVGGPDPFVDLGALSRPAAGTRHLLTLDADTLLPPGQLRALVGMAAHPRNRPRVDPQRGRVTAGFGVLQPRVVTPLSAVGQRTPFHWLFAGQGGIDPYGAASSEVYQDLFGASSFSGKGMIDVAAMHAVLGDRLPEDRVLSHDLLEGSLLRCAAVSDLMLIEDTPSDEEVAASRVHRWTRGDWQLLPFLARPGPGLVDRWKMLDNLRRSLVAPASLLLVTLALAGIGLAPGTALGLVFLAFAGGPLLGALAGLVPVRADLALHHFLARGLTDVARAIAGGLWQIALLLRQAVAAVDAIARTLYRLLWSRRRLLAWTTAASAAARGRSSLSALLRRHAATTLVTLAATGALLAGGTRWPGLVLLLGTAWAATPLWIWFAGRPVRLAAAMTAADQAWLAQLARDTWSFFERCVGPDDNHLPPDNLQVLPHDAVAHRTSPTNIGMYLLAAACAQRFGWIDAEALAARLEATLDTLDRLPRHRGHFLNWYDTQTLAPLLPAYVSSVDSGNLCGHLLAVAAACREVGGPRLAAVADRCDTLAWAPEFGFLVHRRRHLLHVGYRVADRHLDTACYDLLASESRLTSLIAIAKGDLPPGHWNALGRPGVAVGRHAGLRSWSGSMFEYLMPGLVLDEPPGSVLHEAALAAVAEQRAFGAAHDVPWGVSESAHAGRDHTLAYQYAPQGVPGLALRRTPPDELVIAPYASALAAPYALAPALSNLALLQARGARGRHGFIEALDYSPGRQALGEHATPVATFMAHHQGMTLVALANVLLDGAPRRWGMAAPRIEALLPLLHERPPQQLSRRRRAFDAPPAPDRVQRSPLLRREVWPGVAAVGPTHLLSNGRYAVTLGADGSGRSRWREQGLTRWRDDALRGDGGSFLYLRRAPGGPLVSLTQHPAPDADAEYRAVFHADRVALEARWPDLQSSVTVWVSPEDDIEFREVELSNLGDAPIDLELVSAFEPTLAAPGADEAHPAFSNLFLRARWRAGPQALVFERRPRRDAEAPLWATHFITGELQVPQALRLMADRMRWLGRHRGRHEPRGELIDPPTAAGHDGAVLDTGLDPMAALGLRLRIPARQQRTLCFATAAADDVGLLEALIDKYRQPGHVQRASLMSATLAGIRLRTLGIGADNFAAVQLLTTALQSGLARTTAGPSDRRLLWRFGLSGERPIVLASVAAAQDVALLRSLSQALHLWAWGDVDCDLVIVNGEPTAYQTALQQALVAMQDPGTGLHRLHAADLSAAEWQTLRSLARWQLQGDGRPLAHHVREWAQAHEAAAERRQAISTETVGLDPPAGLSAATPAGRFDDGGAGDFVFEVDARTRPPRPWVNVLANSEFGALISDGGGGHSWAGNSRLHQLTPWSNDPVTDLPGEWVLLQDERTRETWSVSPSAWGDPAASYTVAHGQGETVVQHRRGDIDVRVAWCVDPEAAVKRITVRLHNGGTRTLALRIAGMVEWQLGAQRSDRATVETQWRSGPRALALLATQREQAAGFGDHTAFLALAHPEPADTGNVDWTCDRREWFDPRGRLVLPDHLGRQQGGGLDPCAAIAIRLRLAPGASAERVFLLGHARTPEAAEALAQQAAALPGAARTAAARAAWDALLGAMQVKTPDPLFDAMVNRWLLYQAVACRLWAKAGFYQAGGATGFRDQLQDTLALAWAAPELLRAQILRCAGRQYPEGDVQHWWHAPSGAGVRTRVSDDRLWLPWALLHHGRTTGDATLPDAVVPFLEGGPIPPGAEDLYEAPAIGAQTATVFEHAARAIDHSLGSGRHGLPLMGGGDWNDGMNRVGHEGHGESVWLGWFLVALIEGFAPLARARGEEARAATWEAAAGGWRTALEAAGWDGAWYRRAFFDDGSPLGSHANPEARIDLIAQAWAVLSGAAPPARQRAAMAAVQERLVDDEAGLIRLLDPPLAVAVPDAGYIQAYPPGVRENGGQYTHAGVWGLMAQARLATGDAAQRGDRDAVYRWFGYLSPAHRTRHPVQGPRYGLEPYAVAGDVYAQAPHRGRGGWSWYTGAAAWLHRAAIESLFGLRLQARTLSFAPCLPTHWDRAELVLRREGRTLRFVFVQGDAVAEPGATLLAPGAELDWRHCPAPGPYVVPIAPEPA